MAADLREMQENQGLSENRIDKFRFISLPQRTVATVKLTAAVSCFILARRMKIIRRALNVSGRDKFTLCFHHLFDIRRILNYNK